MIKITGKGGITARVLADSISPDGVRLVTYELEFHRYILSEYNTHRAFSRNAASTRAIPILKMLQQITNEPAMPVYYGKNKSGMSASEELPLDTAKECEDIITAMRNYCQSAVAELELRGLHKQHAGRYIEAWQMVKGVVTSTEWDNWFWLRDDEAAQPEIRELARCMRESMEQSKPVLLKPGQWHLPYIDVWFDSNGVQKYGIDEEAEIHVTLEEAIKVSCARCAAVSYRNEGYGLAKSLELYDRLVGSDKKHASALEHCATPMKPHCYEPTVLQSFKPTNVPAFSGTWQEGISHIDRDNNMFSGNLRGWVQYRKLIPGENYVG